MKDIVKCKNCTDPLLNLDEKFSNHAPLAKWWFFNCS